MTGLESVDVRVYRIEGTMTAALDGNLRGAVGQVIATNVNVLHTFMMAKFGEQSSVAVQ